jgi:hypothetical protein
MYQTWYPLEGTVANLVKGVWKQQQFPANLDVDGFFLQSYLQENPGATTVQILKEMHMSKSYLLRLRERLDLITIGKGVREDPLRYYNTWEDVKEFLKYHD